MPNVVEILPSPPVSLDEEQLAWLDLACRKAGIALVVTDRHQRVVTWGGAAELLFGRASKDVVRRACSSHMPSRDCEDGCPVAVAKGPFSTLTELTCGTGGGFFERVAYPLRGLDGAFGGAVELLIPAGTSPRAPSAEPVRLGEVITWDPAYGTMLHRLRMAAPRLMRLHLDGGCPLERRLLVESVRGRLPARRGGAEPEPVSVVEDVGDLTDREQLELARRVVDMEREGHTAPGPRLVTTSAVSPLRLREQGRLRDELFQVIYGAVFTIPALQNRPSDVRPTIEAALRSLAEAEGRVYPVVEPEAWRALLDHDWPGGLSELRHVVRTAWAYHAGSLVTLADLPPSIRGQERAPVEGEVDARRIRDVLRAVDGNITRAAQILGMSRSTLWRRRRQLGV